MSKSQPPTKTDLASLTTAVRKLVAFRDVAASKTDIRELKEHVDTRFDAIDVQLEAIKELLVFRKELRNLIRELKTKGIEVDERKVFVA